MGKFFVIDLSGNFILDKSSYLISHAKATKFPLARMWKGKYGVRSNKILDNSYIWLKRNVH